MSEHMNKRHILIISLFIVSLTVICLLSVNLDRSTTKLLFKEDGIVETASAIGYFVCMAFLLYIAGTHSLKSHWYLYVIFLAMSLRELDFDKRFTEIGILKSRFLISDEVNLPAKIIGGLILLLMIIAVCTWAFRHTKDFITGLLKQRAADWMAAFAIGFIVFTKAIDGIARKLEPWGISFAKDTIQLATYFEEVFELAIPITFIYSMYLYWSFNNDISHSSNDLDI